MRELLDEPLAPRTTLQVGGKARRLVEVDSEAELIELLETVDEPFYVLGGGSNVVIADGEIDALVVAIRTRGVRIERDGDTVDVHAAAGEPWDELVAACVEDGFAGIECLSGIPGLVGATPLQNVGAYGQQVSDCITSVSAYDLQRDPSQDRLVQIPADSCGFDYRSSAFKRRREHVVLGVSFRLRRGSPAIPRYDELRRALDEQATPSATTIREAVLDLRRSKSMVVDPVDPDSCSVGSFFLNPVVEADAALHIARALDLEAIPSFAQPNGRVKLSAAWLIERAGFERGFRRGHVGLSTKHALAIVNSGNATAAEVINLADEIGEAVRRRFGVALCIEPSMFGFKTSGTAPLRNGPL